MIGSSKHVQSLTLTTVLTEKILEVYEAPDNKRKINNKKQTIKDLFDKIQKYVTENNMQTDGIITQLLDDLYLAYWNIGTVGGGMYLFGRHASQGNQQAHTPGNDQIKYNKMNNALNIPPVPVLRRLNRKFNQTGHNVFTTNTLATNLAWPEEVGCDALEHEYSSYSTPGIKTTIESIRLYDE